MPNAFMDAVIEAAVRNVLAGRGGPFAALVVGEGRVLSEGTNLVTSSHDPTAHAEIVAIRNACRALGRHELAGCDIYASCEPCPMCLGAIYWARIASVHYAATAEDAARAGFDDALLYRELRAAADARRLPMRRVAHADALSPFEAWLSKPDRVAY